MWVIRCVATGGWVYSTDNKGKAAVCAFEQEHDAQKEIKGYVDGVKRYEVVRASAKAVQEYQAELNKYYTAPRAWTFKGPRRRRKQ